jgi:hypothetical protein
MSDLLRHNIVRTLELAVAVATMAACGKPADGPGTLRGTSPSSTLATGLPASDCTTTLEEFCRGRCPTYAESVEQLRRSCASAPMDERSAGRCAGAFQMTRTSGPYGGSTMFFDGNGTLIGGTHSTDYGAHCKGTSFGVRAGIIPICPREMDMETLCPGTRR